MSTARALRIGAVWTSIVWGVCYLLLGLIPGLGPTLLSYLFHMNLGAVENIFTVGNFIIGFILWNIIVAAGIALAGALGNYIK